MEMERVRVREWASKRGRGKLAVQHLNSTRWTSPGRAGGRADRILTFGKSLSFYSVPEHLLVGFQSPNYQPTTDGDSLKHCINCHVALRKQNFTNFPTIYNKQFWTWAYNKVEFYSKYYTWILPLASYNACLSIQVFFPTKTISKCIPSNHTPLASQARALC